MTVCEREGGDAAFLTTLFGDSPQTAILRALLSGNELSSRQLVARTGYEPDVLQIAIAKLESEGVIEAWRSGHTTYWRLDADSPLARSLVDLQFAYSSEGTVGESTREFYR